MPLIGDVTRDQPRLRRAWCTAAASASTAALAAACGGEGVVELLLADRLLGGQRAEAVDVLLRLGELRLGLREVPLRLLGAAPATCRGSTSKRVSPW